MASIGRLDALLVASNGTVLSGVKIPALLIDRVNLIRGEVTSREVIPVVDRQFEVLSVAGWIGGFSMDLPGDAKALLRDKGAGTGGR